MAEIALTTKKLLVAFDPSDSGGGAGDFVVPVPETGRVSFVGLRSRRLSVYGRMVYVGKDITVNDLFARLVDSGRKIPSVEQTVRMLQDYVVSLQQHKIGNIVSVETTCPPDGFRLIKIANTPSGAVKIFE